MAKKKKYITDAFEIAVQQFGDTPELRARIEQHQFNMRIAQLIYDSRQKAGLTQKQLAELIGTKQQVIARLEDADYEGHSLTMLQRIAAALGRRLEVSMTPIRRRRKPA
ncbi:MAG TPA: helix-turn-helix transcriptional regulator [Lacipirellulaceae bacterium]|nr:helix-turn-helix transcriptional regulator [Lacipirellulaceae bacterium]